MGLERIKNNLKMKSASGKEKRRSGTHLDIALHIRPSGANNKPEYLLRWIKDELQRNRIMVEEKEKGQ